MNDERRQTIERFYASLQKRDAAGMAACYHPDVVFSDPVFGELRGKEPAAMWHMLLKRGKDLEARCHDIQVEGNEGSARCEADYTFSATGRKVRNLLFARFLFEGDLIIRHDDDFDFWRWQRMALGLPGILLGWLPPFQNKIRRTARKGLDDFIARNPDFQG
ncbi:MAG: nuclear transport factor 2 family protein [Alphaproteobacteria bacterium]|nr:nuclear transport factor 2 family protein [Alphaproteobacteria bacterium]